MIPYVDPLAVLATFVVEQPSEELVMNVSDKNVEPNLPFITQCLEGKATVEDIDIFIDLWHGGEDGHGLTLKAYLGFNNNDEYVRWMKDGDALVDILQEREEQKRLTIRAAVDLLDSLKTPSPKVLHCPECNELHIDEGEWETRLHKTHQCQKCFHEWRPYEYYTVGVAI